MTRGLPRRAMKRFKHGIKDSVSWLGNNSRWTALERLQAKITKYAFPSFFCAFLYLIGPAKSVLMTLNAVPTVVRSSGSFPGAGFVIAVARNLLQP